MNLDLEVPSQTQIHLLQKPISHREGSGQGSYIQTTASDHGRSA